jgi:hypothetical protein
VVRDESGSEFADDAEVVDALIAEVRRVEVEAESRVVTDRGERPAGGCDIEGDFGRVDFERPFDVFAIEHPEDVLPRFTEFSETRIDLARDARRERVEQMPNGAARESVDGDVAHPRMSLLHLGRRGIEELPGPRAVSFISSIARRRTPAVSPSPHTCAGRIDLCRASITSQVA